ncbi:uncharacterized protein LOC117175569 [Belonocnema kinseyi]|uniref:uncharacterized protein LOC117175569 n=1 Tax=Belonocnema kinseyi TaxID=2817044 RepID=UPI00143E02B9|nr:uncharacterized protein LOC117175569 [Belonocnema kinseyi]
MVDDHSGLSNIQKFHYLNSALTGDAAPVIESLGVSDANYTLAWQGLLDRCEGSRSLVHFHVKALFDLPVITKVTFSALRQLIDDANNHLYALKSLGEETGCWDTLVVHLVITKLDFATKREWEKRLLSKRENSNLIEHKITFKDMITFLKNHCKYLHRVATEKPESDNLNNQKKPCTKTGNSKFSQRLTSHAATKKVCPFCQESHTLYSCEKLRALTVESRIDEVRKLHCCFNCLTPGHRNLQP